MALLDNDDEVLVKRGKRVVESDIESYLVKRCKDRGWEAEKFTSPGKRSVPDRIVLKHFGAVFFVECKKPGEKPTPSQARDHDKRRNRGFRVYVVASTEDVDSVLWIESRAGL